MQVQGGTSKVAKGSSSGRSGGGGTRMQLTTQAVLQFVEQQSVRTGSVVESLVRCGGALLPAALCTGTRALRPPDACACPNPSQAHIR